MDGKTRLSKTLRLLAAVAVLGAILACGGSDDDSSSSASTSIEGAPTDNAEASGSGSDEAAGHTVAIPALGLQIDMPSSATVSEIAGIQMVNGGGVSVSVKAAGDFDAETVEAAQESAGIYDPTNIQTESLDDGWVLTFENTGGLGTNYHAQVRREIGGTAYTCTTMLASAESRQ